MGSGGVIWGGLRMHGPLVDATALVDGELVQRRHGPVGRQRQRPLRRVPAQRDQPATGALAAGALASTLAAAAAAAAAIATLLSQELDVRFEQRGPQPGHLGEGDRALVAAREITVTEITVGEIAARLRASAPLSSAPPLAHRKRPSQRALSTSDVSSVRAISSSPHSSQPTAHSTSCTKAPASEVLLPPPPPPPPSTTLPASPRAAPPTITPAPASPLGAAASTLSSSSSA